MTSDWAEIYRSTYQDVVKFLYRKVWDVERARDLAQDTFVRCLGSRPDNPRGWLFRVAANLARDEARLAIRRRKHLALLRAEAAEPASLNGNAAAAEAEAEAERRRIGARRALAALRERDREALLLWDAGLSYKEIADQTGLSPGAVGTTLARARRRLVEAHASLEEAHAAPG